jgi:anti-sigma factor RsiW
MMSTDGRREQGSDPLSDHALWQRCRQIDVPEDEAARYLDLAAFAERRLDPDDEERVAAWLADDPEAGSDVRAARALDRIEASAAEVERVIARACALVPDADPVPGKVIPFARRGGRVARVVAEWGSIAAAIALAGWLGFAMGSGTSLALNEPRQQRNTISLPELFDPPPAFLRDLGEDLRT